MMWRDKACLIKKKDSEVPAQQKITAEGRGDI